MTGPGRRSRFGRPSTWPEPVSLLRRRGRPAFGAVGTRGGRGCGERVWDARRFSMPETSPSAPGTVACSSSEKTPLLPRGTILEMILVVTHPGPGRASCSDWHSHHCRMPEGGGEISAEFGDDTHLHVTAVPSLFFGWGVCGGECACGRSGSAFPIGRCGKAVCGPPFPVGVDRAWLNRIKGCSSWQSRCVC